MGTIRLLALAALLISTGCVPGSNDAELERGPFSYVLEPPARTQPPKEELSGLAVSPGSLSFTALGQTQQLSVSRQFSTGRSADVTARALGTVYSSSNAAVVAVSEDGLVTAVGEGAASVSASNGGRAVFVSALVALTPDNGGGGPPPPPPPPPASLTGLEVSPATVTLIAAGATQQLTVTGVYSDGSRRGLTTSAGTTYQSDQPGVATVSAGGAVSAIANGAAVITASSGGFQATANVTVDIPAAPLTSLTISPPSISFEDAAQRVQLAVLGTYADGTQRDLSAANTGTKYSALVPETASVSKDGLVAPLTTGSTFISVSNAGIVENVEIQVLFCRPSAPRITSAPLQTNLDSITVSGTADADAQVEIVGPAVNFVIGGGAFTTSVLLLPNRKNDIYFTTLAQCGARSSPTVLSVLQDSEPPSVFIDFPTAGAQLSLSAVDVAGRVSDVLSGFAGLTVSVNGVPAVVDRGIGTNGTFFAAGVPLNDTGATALIATATDALGNGASAEISVTQTAIPPNAARMEVSGGNAQHGAVHSQLPQPLGVRMTRADGTPFVNKVVTFSVTRSDGRLSADGSGDGALLFQTHTDDSGIARAYLRLGSDAGCGNNRIEAKSTDIAGSTFFCASADPGEASQINIGSGNRQRGETGGPAVEPLRAWVSDSCNGIPGVPVTFTVTRGGGKVNGLDAVTVLTGETGHAEVTFAYGPDRGNNYIEANFPNNGTGPATFVLFGVPRAEADATFSGQIFDNSSQPLGGATLFLTVGGLPAGEAVSGSDGRFSITIDPPEAAGAANLHVEGSTIDSVGGAPRPTDVRYPNLGFVTLVVPGGANALSAPILLPPLSTVNDRVFDGGQAGDLELTCAGIDGLKMKVKAGTTITLPDGSQVGPNDPGQIVLSINQVHHDSVPMPMPDGVAPPFAWTFQPGGLHFEPPVEIEYPNMTGLPAGGVANFLSFNHETNKFEIVASGCVSADGSTIVSDPGVGISISGWGCNCPPYSVTGTCESDGSDDGDDDGCSGADCDQEPGNCAGGGAGSDDDKCSNAKGSSQGGSCGNGQTDPVNLFCGEFVWEEEDLRIPGRGFDFVWTRTYRSRTRDWSGLGGTAGNIAGLGPNWDHPYNLRLKPVGTSLWLCDGTGRIDSYTVQPDGAWSKAEFFRTITQNSDGTYTLHHPDQRTVLFAPVAPDGHLVVSSITDRNGNRMSFEYDESGRLATIIDTLGRPIVLSYDDKDRIIELRDFAGRTVRYEYGEDHLNHYYQETGACCGSVLPNCCSAILSAVTTPGELISATRPVVSGTANGNDFPQGKTTRYEYSPPNLNEQLEHNLTAILDARGRRVVENAYFGPGGLAPGFVFALLNPVSEQRSFLNYRTFFQAQTVERVSSHQWGDDGQSVEINYSEVVPTSSNGMAVRRTTTNDRNGNVVVRQYDAGNRLVQQLEYTGRSALGDPVDVPTGANPPLNPIRPGDPVSFNTRWEYAADSRIKRIIHPNGNETQYVYEFELNPTAPRTAQGNVREIHFKPGTHQPAGDQDEIVEQMEYDTGLGSCCGGFNFITRYVDGRGNEMHNEFDARGNRTKLIHAIPSIEEEWEYNEFGQVTAHVHPDNGSGQRRRDEYFYYSAGSQKGYLQSMTIDAGGLALTISYEYDAVGNVVRKTDPKGNDIQYEVNALNQVVRETSRDAGGGVRYQKNFFYNANDKLVRVDVLNVDEAGNVRENANISTLFEYDTLNHLTRIARESGNYADDIPGTPDEPDLDALPQSEFVVTRLEYDANRNLTLVESGQAVSGAQPGNTLRVRYDERNLPFQIVRGEGTAEQSTTQVDYDRNGNPVAVTTGLEGTPHVSTFVYDGYNRMVSATDPMGNTMASQYDATSNLVHSLMMGDLVDQSGGDNNVRLAEVTQTFDAKNRLTRREQAFFDAQSQAAIADGASVEEIVWADISRMLRVTNDNAHATSYAYDGAHRLSQMTDAKGNTTSYEFDANSNIVKMTEVDKSEDGASEESFVTTYGYDGLDRRTSIIDNIGDTHRYAYDSRNNVVRYINARGNVVNREFDGLNRLLRTVRLLTTTGSGDGEPAGDITTSQTWDDNSRITSRSDDNGHTTQYEYDALDRLISETMADQTAHRFTYDVHGNRVSATDANGSLASATFDLLNRLTGVSVKRAPSVLGTTFESFQYDGRSRLVQVQDDDSLVTRAYDSLSHVIRETQNGQTVVSVFDGVENMLACTYPGGRQISATFDELERKKTVSDESGMIAAYTFLGPRRVVTRDYANGTSMKVDYDGIRRIVGTTHTAGATIIDARTYTWDAMNNKAQRRDTRVGGPGLTHEYGYDSANRLIQTRVTDLQFSLQRLTGYELDGVHNRVRVTGGPDDGEYVGEYALNTGGPTFDAEMNQYSATPFDTRDYDANGNWTSSLRTPVCDPPPACIGDVDGSGAVEQADVDLVSQNLGAPPTGAAACFDVNHDGFIDAADAAFVQSRLGTCDPPGATQLKYDFRNRMVEYRDGRTGVRSTYAYDALGRRFEKVVDADGPSPQATRFFYSGWREIEEQDAAGATLATYTYGHYIDEVLTMQRGGQDYYYHASHPYDTVAITDTHGVEVERYEYDEYGQHRVLRPDGVRIATSQIDNFLLFNSRRLDTENGLYAFRTRYYDAQAGSFTSRDSITIWGDRGSHGNGNAFVHSNPTTYLDPYGMNGLGVAGGGPAPGPPPGMPMPPSGVPRAGPTPGGLNNFGVGPNAPGGGGAGAAAGAGAAGAAAGGEAIGAAAGGGCAIGLLVATVATVGLAICDVSESCQAYFGPKMLDIINDNPDFDWNGSWNHDTSIDPGPPPDAITEDGDLGPGDNTQDAAGWGESEDPWEGPTSPDNNGTTDADPTDLDPTQDDWPNLPKNVPPITPPNAGGVAKS